REINIGFSATELKQDIIDVAPVFKGNDPYLWQTTIPMEYELIQPSDYGFPSVGTVMVANASFIKSNPDVVLRYVKAFLRGADHMLKDKQSTIDITARYAGPGLDRGGHAFIYDVTKKDMEDGDAKSKGVGTFNKQKWQESLDFLMNLNLIKAKPKVDDLIDTQFVDQAIKDGKLVWP
ncbi:MAG: ABC transporter substrate-binding protein, partial [Chloroflexi bacterium]|nr:ABC transporter substrate-binding protein [Chloroflexota bacterium]